MPEKGLAWHPHSVVMTPFIMAMTVMPMMVSLMILRPGGKRNERRNDAQEGQP